MSLYVKNIARSVVSDRLGDLFGSRGPCQIENKYGFAFIEYDRDADAKDAIREL